MAAHLYYVPQHPLSTGVEVTEEVPVNMNSRASSTLSAGGASKASSGWSNIMARTLHLAVPVASPHYCLTADANHSALRLFSNNSTLASRSLK